MKNQLLLLIAFSSSMCQALCFGESKTPLSVEWSLSTPLPEPRAGYAAGILNGKLIIAGGSYWEGQKGNWIRKLYTTRTHAFDPTTQRWEELPDMPLALSYAASVVVGDRLYVLGGHSAEKQESSKIYALEWNDKGYRWIKLGDLPGPRVFARAVRIGHSIFLLGGLTQFEPYDTSGTCCTSKSATQDLLFFDTVQPKRGWQQLPSFPGAKRWLFCAETDGESIWMVGGIDQQLKTDPTTEYDEVWRYDVHQKKWGQMASLPREARGTIPFSSLMLEERLLVFSFAKKVWALDLQSRQFGEISPLPEEVFVDQFFWLDRRIIGTGGENKLEGPRRRSEWTFIGRLVGQ